jgi:hypothetical protein
MMSEDPKSLPPPRKDTRFKKGQSGNPKGRPRKARRALVPSQLRKDILAVADEEIELSTPKGRVKLTKQQLIIKAISNGAAKGSPTALRMWMKLFEAAVDQRFAAHPTVRLVEMLIDSIEDPRFDANPETVRTLDAHLKKTRNTY